MSSLALSAVLTSRRAVWMAATEETEYRIYEHDPELFLTYSPELALMNREAHLKEYRRQKALAEIVNQAIAALPPVQQTIIRLRYFSDGADAYTAKDVADKLDISLRSYYNYLNEAKAALRQQLECQPVVMEYFSADLDD